MVADHEFEEEPVEYGAARLPQPGQLRRGEHAGHGAMLGVAAGRARHGLAAFGEPAPHLLDLVPLRNLDPSGERWQVGAGGAPLDQRRHVQCLSMVEDHPLHEQGVGGGEAGRRERGELVLGQGPARLARRPRLHHADARRPLRRPLDELDSDERHHAEGEGGDHGHGDEAARWGHDAGTVSDPIGILHSAVRVALLSSASQVSNVVGAMRASGPGSRTSPAMSGPNLPDQVGTSRTSRPRAW